MGGESPIIDLIGIEANLVSEAIGYFAIGILN
jgi:hypothetical protein